MNTDFFGEKVIRFYQHLDMKTPLPQGVEVMRPFDHPDSAAVASQFYRKFYSDTRPRIFIIGINPGRFGGGVTGVPFTDPVKLEKYCGISSNFSPKTELSADFIYQIIQALGGAAEFYSKYYFTSVSPLGFTRHGVNMNYYDDKQLLLSVSPYTRGWLSDQLAFGSVRSRCICLGSGKNRKFLQRLNQENSFFNQIQVLDHPRFIMQYKRRQIASYIDAYKAALG